ncbi:uncharacterized protein J3R85_017751 [Psidium guajava]|nr:uncharacterized protein J3R85_017751 [Psidium guajava]
MVRNSSDCGTTFAVKASRGDGYSWRKYGQKQVKSARCSRSYFRCTNSECSAKKIECSDMSSHTIETLYRSSHNHAPHQKVRDGRQRSLVKSAGVVAESEVVERPLIAKSSMPWLLCSYPDVLSRLSLLSLLQGRGAFPNIELAVSAARPGDTILIAAGGSHVASNIQIK